MTPVEFEIRVADVVPPEILSQLPDVVMSAQAVGTVLIGTAVDQAAFHGVINRIRGHGLELVEVRRRPETIEQPGTEDFW
jgi:hypothetical protein